MSDEPSAFNLDRCCICGQEITPADLIVEDRPSGNSGDLEEWSYCLHCWFGMTKLRQQELRLERLLQVLDL